MKRISPPRWSIIALGPNGVSDGEPYSSPGIGLDLASDHQDQLIFARDIALPHTLERLNRLEVLYLAWAERNQENARPRIRRLWECRIPAKPSADAMAGC